MWNQLRTIQITAGTPDFQQWRCLYFDGRKLHTYDSSGLSSYDLLVHIEKEFIRQHYPNISQTDVTLEWCPIQQDNYFCGVFSAVNATMLALGHNPTDIRNYAVYPVMYEQTVSREFYNHVCNPYCNHLHWDLGHELYYLQH